MAEFARFIGSGYLLAVLATAVVSLFRWIAADVVGDPAPFLPFVGAVLLAAWRGGLKPGLLATILGGAAGLWFAHSPPSFSGTIPAELMSLFMFLTQGVAIGCVFEALRRTQRQLVAEQTRLIAEVQERQSANLKLNAIIDSSPLPIVMLELNENVRLWNRAASNVFGWSESEMIGHPCPVVTSENAAVWKQLLATVAGGGAVTGVETVVSRKEHGSLQVRMSAAPVWDDTGRIIQAVVMIEDVTERTLAEDRSRRGEERMLLATEAVNGLIYELDYPSGAVWRSSALRSLIGVDTADAEPTMNWWLERCHPDDVNRLQAEILGSQNSNRYSTTYRVRHVDGRYIHVWDQGIIFPDASGRACRSVGCAVDTTKQHEAEQQIRRSEERFRLLADAMPQMVYVSGADARLEYLNNRWRDYTGRTTADSGDLHEVIHPDDLQNLNDRWAAAFAGGTQLTAEFRLRNAKTGEYRWFLTRAVPILDADGRVMNWFGTSTDIQDQKQAEEALRQADRRKDEFLALLAHELRNPLAPVRQGVQLMSLTALPDDPRRETLHMMDRQLDQLIRLVDDLLDVSRIGQGKLDLRMEQVDMAAVIAHAIETTRSMIEGKNHTLLLDLPPEPMFVDGDFTRLSQIISNLLNNSAKYTPPGGRIRLSVETEAGFVRVSVRDSGVGIPRNMLPKIFDLYMQVDRSLDMAQGGLGIGLSLVRQLLELHGGTVEAHSEGYGLGSEFIIRLPSCEPPEPSPETLPAVQRTHVSRRILVVDDNQDAAESLALMFRLMGHDTQTAHDGLAAVELAATVRPDLILLDIGMPKLDGYAAARRIRELPGSEAITLVALSGWGQEEDRRKSAEAGINRHLVKPVDLAALQDVLATLP
ncbi:PAS domain-containing protein [Zavarzinella formosa]|uniref:PAS domain-containing protein n=1 Tax=Zavarzinella formosa TaxID=360055 RepID=UPI0002EB07BB|nr:PAS domain-containing protein [Zavarzinella formosa]